MHALITIGAFLIIGATAQYIDPFVDPNCPYKNGRLLHDPRNHIGPGLGLIGSGYDTPAVGHRVDISVGQRINPVLGRRWKRSAYGRRSGYDGGNRWGSRRGGWRNNDRWGDNGVWGNDRWGNDRWGNDRWGSRRGGRGGRGGY